MVNFSLRRQRIFAWTILLIVVLPSVFFFVFKAKFDDYEFKQQLIKQLAALARQLEKGSLDTVTPLIEAMNCENARLWVEQSKGTMLTGKFIFEKQEFFTAGPISENAATILLSPTHESLYITATPFLAQGEPAIMYLACHKVDSSSMFTLFYRVFIFVLILGGGFERTGGLEDVTVTEQTL